MLDDHVLGNPRELGAFETIVKQMLEDVQERLVYRANIYIKTDILGFQPSSGDLAYPDKLQMMEDIAQSLNKEANANPEMVEVQLNSSSDHDDARKGNKFVVFSEEHICIYENRCCQPCWYHIFFSTC
jgi:hypothetical protein